MKFIRLIIIAFAGIVIYVLSGLFLVAFLDSACKVTHLCEGGHEDAGIFALLSLLIAVFPTWFCFKQMWLAEKQKTKRQLERIARQKRVMARQMNRLAQQREKDPK
jgi:hypothetical protein